MTTNRQEIQKLITVVNNELQSLGYDEDTIITMNQLMVEILMYFWSTGLGSIIYHKNTAQTLRSLANIIDLMAERK